MFLWARLHFLLLCTQEVLTMKLKERKAIKVKSPERIMSVYLMGTSTSSRPCFLTKASCASAK
jgi:hypothetical protein